MWRKVVLALGAPESFSKNRIQKHPLFNPYALESEAWLLSFDSELKCLRNGILTLEDLNLHANSQLLCKKKKFFYMYLDNKACEMCVGSFLRPQLGQQLCLQRWMWKTHLTSVHRQKCSSIGHYWKANVWSYCVEKYQWRKQNKHISIFILYTRK